jgi:hypothetical protein
MYVCVVKSRGLCPKHPMSAGVCPMYMYIGQRDNNILSRKRRRSMAMAIAISTGQFEGTTGNQQEGQKQRRRKIDKKKEKELKGV